MKAEDTKHFHRWFTEYVKPYYCGDIEVDEGIRLKEGHSRRVAAHMRAIARALSLSESDVHLADAVGLFHDLGRFPQWQRYKTFNDARSVDHGALSVDALRTSDVLAPLAAAERRIIEVAARYHNKKNIPKNLSSRHRLFTQMVRDADKIDIWHLEISHFEKQPPHRPILTRLLRGEFPITAAFSQEIFDSVMHSERPNIEQVRTHHDFVLFRLSWIYDINFMPSAKIILKRRYVEKLLGRLAHSRDVERLKHHLIGHLEQMQGRPES